MTLNIDLEDVPFAILEAVKARILRNRRLLDLYNQQNPQPSLRPGPQFVKQGASRRGWRLQKTAAMALGDGPRRIAHCGLIAEGSGSGYTRGIWAAFSGDFTSQIIESRSAANFDGAAFGHFVLPVKGETCILVLYARIRGKNYVFGGGYTVETRAIISRAWLCSLSTVRQLSIPSGLASVLSQLNGGDDYSERDTINGVDVSPFPPRAINDNMARGWQYHSVDAYDPTIYEVLNKLSSFVDSNQIKQFPSTFRPIIEDVRYSFPYLDPEDQDDITEPALYYSEWLGSRDADLYALDWSNPNVASLIRPLTGSTRRFPSSWKEELNIPSDFILTRYAPGALLLAWDWDDPSYCRRMCLALGFSDADLRP